MTPLQNEILKALTKEQINLFLSIADCFGKLAEVISEKEPIPLINKGDNVTFMQSGLSKMGYVTGYDSLKGLLVVAFVKDGNNQESIIKVNQLTHINGNPVFDTVPKPAEEKIVPEMDTYSPPKLPDNPADGLLPGDFVEWINDDGWKVTGTFAYRTVTNFVAVQSDGQLYIILPKMITNIGRSKEMDKAIQKFNSSPIQVPAMAEREPVQAPDAYPVSNILTIVDIHYTNVTTEVFEYLKMHFIEFGDEVNGDEPIINILCADLSELPTNSKGIPEGIEEVIKKLRRSMEINDAAYVRFVS